MQTLRIIVPVFFMMLLGVMSRKYHWIGEAQNEGTKKIVFTVLFPIMIFHVLLTSRLSSRFLLMILFADLVWIMVYFIGKGVRGFTGKRFAHLSPYLLLTCEGGSVALPLYLTLAESTDAVNIISFDVAGILINFILLPILVLRQSSGKVETGALLRKIGRSSFLLAVILGSFFNLSGLYGLLMESPFGEVYTNTAEIVMEPIKGILLFTLGYDLTIRREMLKPLVRLALVRLLCCTGIIFLFFLIMPISMQETAFRAAVLLYFMCPTGFPVPLQLMPLVKDSEDENFMSAFISLFMLVALIAYTVIAVFVV